MAGMDTVTREETRFIQKIIIFIIIPVIGIGFLKMRLANKSEAYQEKISGIEERVSRYIKKKGSIPSVRRVAQAEDILKRVQDKQATVLSFTSVPPITPPEEVIEKGVYFKKQLYLAYKSIKEKADKNETGLPDSLGFGEALPAERDVPVLLRKLETVDKVLAIILASNVKAVTVIKLLDDQHYKDSDGQAFPFTEAAVRVDVNCTAPDLKRILFEVGNVKPFITVKDISVKNIKDGVLEASFVFARLITEK